MSLPPFFHALSEASSTSTSINFIFYLAFSLGLVKLTTLALSLFSLFVDLYVLPATNFKVYGSESHTWAVVTGATDGLGKEFAIQLAEKGFNILLVSRTASKLQEISLEIESKYEVKTKVYAYDFTDASNESIGKFKEFVASSDIDISILINNVGKSHSIPVPFSETSTEELTDIVTINNLTTLKFTQTLIPYLSGTVNQKKLAKKALILNIGSFSGLLPTPYLATYSGSKAFLQNWSSSLSRELVPEHIDVRAVLAYLITSKMSKIRKTSALIPDPKEFVSATLDNFTKRCGAQERYGTVTPFWTHAIAHWAIESTVGVYSAIANKLNYDMHKNIRTRALKKAARKKAE